MFAGQIFSDWVTFLNYLCKFNVELLNFFLVLNLILRVVGNLSVDIFILRLDFIHFIIISLDLLFNFLSVFFQFLHLSNTVCKSIHLFSLLLYNLLFPFLKFINSRLDLFKLIKAVAFEHLLEDRLNLKDLSLLFNILDGLLFLCSHALQFILNYFHSFSFFVFHLFICIVFLDSFLNFINELIWTNDVFQILQKSRFISIARFLLHLWNLLNLALKNQETIVGQINTLRL